jgi:ABC-type sugar transport system substrate-binding protein
MIKADNTIFKCSLTYLPDMGVDAVRMAVKILAGEEFKVNDIIESISVTKANVDQFMDKGY